MGLFSKKQDNDNAESGTMDMGDSVANSTSAEVPVPTQPQVQQPHTAEDKHEAMTIQEWMQAVTEDLQVLYQKMDEIQLDMHFIKTAYISQFGQELKAENGKNKKQVK